MIRNIIFVLLISNSIQAMDKQNQDAIICGKMCCAGWVDLESYSLLEKDRLSTEALLGITIDKNEIAVDIIAYSKESEDWAAGHSKISEGQSTVGRAFPNQLPLKLLQNCHEGEFISFDFYGKDKNGNRMKPVTIKLQAAQQSHGDANRRGYFEECILGYLRDARKRFPCHAKRIEKILELKK